MSGSSLVRVGIAGAVLTVASVFGLVACKCSEAPSAVPGTSNSAAAPGSASALALPSAPAPARPPSFPPVPGAAFSPAELGALVRDASERGGTFISDNFVSNETSYLHPASALEKLVRPGGAYLGVGPEQNFTYIALTRPKLAFIVDIRRDNLLEHLLYKELFELAQTRSHLLCMLLGRPWSLGGDPGQDATLERVLSHVARFAPSEAELRRVDAVIRKRLAALDAGLTEADFRRIERIHHAFFEKQLALRFDLGEANGREYPTLKQLILATDTTGLQRGFLATEAAFRWVRTMQRQNRIVPLVGDFAGNKALGRVASALRSLDLTVSLFYVSNVEQYLLEDGKWRKWVENLKALPTDDQSLLLRVYFDQGKPHPLQRAGHRTTSVLQRFEQFFDHQAHSEYASMWELATEDVVGAAAPSR
ncbi:MAG TPA: hypothetical protein VF989_12550 [Polyangiaceae bacterium]